MVAIEIIRHFPEEYKELMRLKHRLPKHHKRYEEITKKIDQISAGYFGEARTDRFIEEVQFPNEVRIISDFHVKIHEKRYIQIDTLIITRSYALVVEIKNIVGTLRFKKDPDQLVRIKDNLEEKSFSCPLVQLERNCDGLSKILSKYKLNLPIRQALIFSSHNTIIENAPKKSNIYFVKQFPLFIQKLNDSPFYLSEEEFLFLSNKLSSLNNNFTRPSLCDRLKIDPNDLKKGVLCKHCGNNLLRKSAHHWLCYRCKGVEFDPILRNIEDFFLLIQPTLSIKDCMHFLQINSRYTIYNSLKKMQLQKTGQRKSTQYILINKKPLPK